MTREEIQYKAQSIMQEYGSTDSAPYIEFVEELARTPIPEPKGLDEAKKKHIDNIAEDHSEAYERINREMDERQKWRDGHPKEYAKQLDDAVKEYERLDEAAEESARSWRKNPDGSESREIFFQPHIRGFKAGAKWGEKDTIERAVKWWEKNLRYLIATANVRDTYLTDFKRDMEEGL